MAPEPPSTSISQQIAARTRLPRISLFIKATMAQFEASPGRRCACRFAALTLLRMLDVWFGITAAIMCLQYLRE